MKPHISVIIPVLNEARVISSLLTQLSSHSQVEVLVVDGGSRDGTQALVTRFPQARCIASAVGRGVQQNAGAMEARGDILWFLHADSDIPEDFFDEICRILAEPGVVAGSFRLGFERPNRWLKLFGYCSRLDGSLFTYGDQGYFMSRRAFVAAGRFREYPILEDLDLQKRLRYLGDWKKSRLTLTTSSRRFIANGVVWQQLKNVFIVACFLAGASPGWLARFYPPESGTHPKPSAHSDSLKPAALKSPAKRKGRFTRFPFSVSS